MSDKILVFGHQKPDTDAIGSSMSYAYLRSHVKNGAMNTEAVALGEANEETQFALDTFGLKLPRIVKSAKEEGVDTVILTDHNEFQQSISDIEDVTILGVVDHHRIANFHTAQPLFMDVQPVGSASSIVYRQFLANDVEIPAPLAGMMLSGLISDTLLLKSPTTHPTDFKVAEELAKIAGVDLQEYGLAMLKAGTNLASKSADELIDIDAKTFELNGSKVRVAQVNTVDINEVLERLTDVKAAIKKYMAAGGFDDFVFMITDIVNSNSEIVEIGSHPDKVEAAFHFTLNDDHAFLAGAVSRKKQVVPQLTEAFEG